MLFLSRVPDVGLKHYSNAIRTCDHDAADVSLKKAIIMMDGKPMVRSPVPCIKGVWSSFILFRTLSILGVFMSGSMEAMMSDKQTVNAGHHVITLHSGKVLAFLLFYLRIVLNTH